MKRENISGGSVIEEKVSYSRVVVAGDFIFVSGTTGFDYGTMEIDDHIEIQTEQCFQNISEALAKANPTLKDVVKVLYIVPEVSKFEKCWPVIDKYLGDVRPAAIMISAALLDSRMKIEIEVTDIKAV